MTVVLTHRGLEPSRKRFYKESSLEAFTNHLKRGFGVEFDVNFTKDKKIVVVHDKNLSRITNNKDSRSINEITYKEARSLNLCPFDKLMSAISASSSSVNALHLKGLYQDTFHLDILIKKLQTSPELLSKLIIFDVKTETAEYLHKGLPGLKMAPSVAHSGDIKRFNSFVSGTLMLKKEAIKNKRMFSWVWLDEWGPEKFYTRRVFDLFRKNGLKVSIVTPELHATSPGLYANESHPDAINKTKLFHKIKEILDLKPDAICTDYPEEVRGLIKAQN